MEWEWEMVISVLNSARIYVSASVPASRYVARLKLGAELCEPAGLFVMKGRYRW